MIENPMVLNQHKYDAQMMDYPMACCDYCNELIEEHNTTVFADGSRICCDCEKHYLWDMAGQENYDNFCLIRPIDYLVKWWFANLSNTEKVAILWGAYTNREWLERVEQSSHLAKDHEAYCKDREDEFLRYMKEELL